ncbi:hypothetical protein V8F33_009884 [Rhypophila sp. PSN 637]
MPYHKLLLMLLLAMVMTVLDMATGTEAPDILNHHEASRAARGHIQTSKRSDPAWDTCSNVPTWCPWCCNSVRQTDWDDVQKTTGLEKERKDLACHVFIEQPTKISADLEFQNATVAFLNWDLTELLVWNRIPAASKGFTGNGWRVNFDDTISNQWTDKLGGVYAEILPSSLDASSPGGTPAGGTPLLCSSISRRGQLLCTIPRTQRMYSDTSTTMRRGTITRMLATVLVGMFFTSCSMLFQSGLAACQTRSTGATSKCRYSYPDRDIESMCVDVHFFGTEGMEMHCGRNGSGLSSSLVVYLLVMVPCHY